MITKCKRRVLRISSALTLGAILCAPPTAMAAPMQPNDEPGSSADMFSLSAISPARLQAILNIAPNPPGVGQIDDEHVDVSTLSAIVVEGSTSKRATLEAASAPCGLLGIFWSLVHPAAAWRIVAPILPSVNADACFQVGFGRVTAASPWSSLPR